MKWLSTILLVYVLALTLMPCTDNDLVPPSQMAATSLVQHNHQAEKTGSHDHKQDSCSPFCSCSCCGITLSTIYFQTIHVEKPFTTFLPMEITREKFPLISNILENIWQPPRV
ncbi:DUF6660 family protein [Sphingobacterium psychroaquaticum]|uniref:Uncharacterized protein n=1 Tax=Sphingobacterium psychroaquaticum TaxID=561061 RepID=A0A1X7I349_9SPHI|nr:DUF6660 family protein [Sphingobacterium psychroaquaticum]QBQ42011.1 hypothetical protein E2P86_12975 [Sphingobacterium psychroaquaticum]SMG08122.1 hypothetical protein SAMN05660862_0350 [Sphingobacterium psychroaquaticum]